MAKAVKLAKGRTFEFSVSGAKGFTAKYPWDQWFSGDLLMIERSDGPENAKGTIEAPTTERDYGVPTDAMLPKIKTAARARYKVCQISRKDADGKRLVAALIIRARDMTVEEKAFEDILRVEEKAVLKAMDAAETQTVAEGKAAGLDDAAIVAAVKAARRAAADRAWASTAATIAAPALTA